MSTARPGHSRSQSVVVSVASPHPMHVQATPENRQRTGKSACRPWPSSVHASDRCQKMGIPRTVNGNVNQRKLSAGKSAVAWRRAPESEARLWVAGRRVKVVPPRLPSASTLTRRPASGDSPLGFCARKHFPGRMQADARRALLPEDRAW